MPWQQNAGLACETDVGLPVLIFADSPACERSLAGLSVLERLIIAAHDAELSAISLSADGQRLATASEKGTIIRVWDTLSGAKLNELRRGSVKAEIYSIAFNESNAFLAASSSSGVTLTPSELLQKR